MAKNKIYIKSVKIVGLSAFLNFHSLIILFFFSETNDMDCTPLHVATECGSTEIVKLLCSQENIDVLKKDEFGFTALDLAFEKKFEGHYYESIYTLLLDYEVF